MTEPIWLVWTKIILPLVVSSVTVVITYRLTTEKERKSKQEHRDRADTAEPAAYYLLTEMLKNVLKAQSKAEIREFMAKAKSACEYCELATSDVYSHKSFEEFTRFATLKRISYHFRDILEKQHELLLMGKDLSQIAKFERKFQTLVEDVNGRLKPYRDYFENDPFGMVALARVQSTPFIRLTGLNVR